MDNAQELYLDIMDSRNSNYFYLKQYDQGRTLVVIPTDNGVPLDLTDVIATVEIKKPDNTVIISNATISDGKIIYITETQVSTVFGTCNMQIKLYSNNKVFATVTCNIKISESTVKDDDVISSNEFNALDNALQEVNDLINGGKIVMTVNKGASDGVAELDSNALIKEIQLPNGYKNIQADWSQTSQSDESFIKNKPTSMPASDVYDWAKQQNKPTYTPDEIGALSPIDKGVANGVCELDENGIIITSQLPSYVDDILEGVMNSELTEFVVDNIVVTPETGKIYVDITTNKSYRWGGTIYVFIGSDLALGETSSTAYRGDRGKLAYEHSQTVTINDDTTSTLSPTPGETFTVVDSVTRDNNGHVNNLNTKNITLPITPIVVDSELSNESENPVQNKIITNKINNIHTSLDTKLTNNNIINELTSTSTSDALSANQGSVLQANKCNVLYISRKSFAYSLTAGQIKPIGGTNGDLAIDGYTLLGVVGYVSNHADILPSNLTVNRNTSTLVCYLRNLSTTSTAAQTFFVDCLYTKN